MASARRYVALLRGINVGRARRIAMSDLRAVVESLGHTAVRTHLQSGNVVLTTPRRMAADTLARELEAAIAAQLGHDLDVVVRSRDDVEAVVALDPLRAVVTDPSRYLVAFLGQAPAATLGARLADAAREPEAVELHGREVYLWCPDGVHLSKGWKSVDTAGAVVTARNWNTVTRVLELLDD